MEEADEMIRAEEQKHHVPSGFSPVDESNTSISSRVSRDGQNEEGAIPKLTEADVVRIIGDLKKGDYDAKIMELWKTVDMTEYNVETHSVFLPLVCYG